MSVLGKMNLNEALRVLLHFELSGTSTGTPAYLVGRVTSWQENDGRYAWPVRFSDGKVFSMEVEELARELSHSHSRGLGITAVPE
ncbi:hypothetical protein L915_15896 [Phytophthora nicotianae]|uniref:Uncharacterized protein n=1 Tax=Phytophthora nicotianae TaxID=4792 RepID=W2G4R5_PHYNI|nr:hypothetical protein L915_15896 [Phytophthora nicotianae]